MIIRKTIWIGRENDSVNDAQYYVNLKKMDRGYFAASGAWICVMGAKAVLGTIRLRDGQQIQLSATFEPKRIRKKKK